MNRAMYSGVAGVKTHQTKMDVIGNNIANVNTYGYKAQRAVFSDIYYQTLKGAAQGTSTRGGVSPSTMGQGSRLASIQTHMAPSGMLNTGFGLDAAIAGEAFFQVEDPSGNYLYTRAGLFDYDADGYMVDVNGYFVLGVNDVSPGATGRERIKLNSAIEPIEDAQASASRTIQGITYTMKASTSEKAGNVNIILQSDSSMPVGEKARAVIGSTGSVAVYLNPSAVFKSLSELNQEINAAITKANNGAHPGGTFTLSITRKDTGGSDVNVEQEVFNPALAALLGGGGLRQKMQAGISGAPLSSAFLGGAKVTGVNDDFPYTGVLDFSASSFTEAEGLRLKAAVNGVTYECLVPAGSGTLTSGGNVKLEVAGEPARGSVSMTIPGLSAIVNNTVGTTAADLAAATLAAYSGASLHNYAALEAVPGFLGGATVSVSSGFSETGAVEFATSYANVGDDLGITATVNGKLFTGAAVPNANLQAKQTITLTSTEAAGNIRIEIPPIMNEASFAADLTGTPINNQHNYTVTGAVVSAGITGSEITSPAGTAASGSISGFPVAGFDLRETSKDFVGRGTVDGFSLTYSSGAGAQAWMMEMLIGGRVYSARLPEGASASAIMLKNSAEGDTITLNMPSSPFSSLVRLYEDENANTAPTDGDVLDLMALTTTTPYPSPSGANPGTAAPPAKSHNLGLSGESFNLSGGIEGRAVDMAQMNNIHLSVDGVIYAGHPTKGEVAVGKLTLISFNNPRGLKQEGVNYYSETVNSGSAELVDPASGGIGSLRPNALEMSNVELSEEFAEMITTQRGFQANTRVITVSDTMLEELINLKR